MSCRARLRAAGFFVEIPPLPPGPVVVVERERCRDRDRDDWLRFELVKIQAQRDALLAGLGVFGGLYLLGNGRG